MSSTFSITLPSGTTWTPTFVQHINEDKCSAGRAADALLAVRNGVRICLKKCYTHQAHEGAVA